MNTFIIYLMFGLVYGLVAFLARKQYTFQDFVKCIIVYSLAGGIFVIFYLVKRWF